MDQYVSWCLPAEELALDTMWGKFEEFCKPQSNKVRACFDLLTSFKQGNKSIDEWHNVVQAQVNLAKYPPATAKILHTDIFWLFLRDEEFVSRTISDGNVDLDKFLASRVWQLSKRMESSKATVCHITQVAGDPQAAQIILLRHQHTELPAGKYRKKKSSVKSRQSNYKHHGSENSQVQSQHRKWFDVKSAQQSKDRCSKCGDSTHVEGFQCLAKTFQCKACHKFGHFTSLCYQRKQAPFKSRKPKVHQLQAGTVYAKESVICSQSEDDSSSKDSFCLQVKLRCKQANLQQIPMPTHLITNLAYRLKPHHTGNLYLRARLDTCADVDSLPASMYKLVFPRSRHEKACPQQVRDWDLYNWHCEDCCFLHVLSSTHRYHEIDGCDILCCCEWWQCVIVLQNNTDVRVDTTQNKIGLSPTKS